MTEETDWIGGQMTQQGVPPDEHQWIETHGATQAYRDLRTAIRQYYFDHYPVTTVARQQPYFNPGDGAVSRLCHEPRVALAVLHHLFAPYLSNRQLTLLLHHRITGADTDGDRVRTTSGAFRYVWPSELDLMAELAGLELEHRWADWHRSPFTGESPAHVSVWQRVR